MFQGELLAIYIADRKNADLRPVEEVQAVAGQGLVGDRYLQNEGQNSPDREVTLIEIESLEALQRDSQIGLQPGQARRNLVTRGVPLNHLVGQEFMVGEVRLRGIRLCEPCGHLESLTVRGVKNGLVHRGGLRAQIVEGGTLKTGAAVRPGVDCQRASSNRG